MANNKTFTCPHFKLITKNWWQKIFNETYLLIYSDNEAYNQKIAEFIIKALKLKPGDKVLDLACGYGRISFPLVKRGILVIGVDLSNYFIKLAQNKLKNLKLKNIKFVKGDIRKIKFKNKFDAVISIFTSFGYFEKEEENLKVIHKVYESLKNGGKFLLDLENPAWFLKTVIFKPGFFIDKDTNFPTSLFRRKISKLKNFDDIYKYDYFCNRIIIEQSFYYKNKKIKYGASFKLYSLDEIKIILEKVGFKITKVYGNYDTEKYTKTSPRMIIVAEK